MPLKGIYSKDFHIFSFHPYLSICCRWQAFHNAMKEASVLDLKSRNQVMPQEQEQHAEGERNRVAQLGQVD